METSRLQTKSTKGSSPVSLCSLLSDHLLHHRTVTAEDIAEEIVWAAARPPHVNIAELFVLPTNQASPTLAYRGGK